MVKAVLKNAGFLENKTFREARFLKPPQRTYCVYFDSCQCRGADDRNLIKDHSYTIEMYSSTPDQAHERAIEKILAEQGIEYEKEDRMWIQEEKLYQVVYNFDYTEKIMEE